MGRICSQNGRRWSGFKILTEKHTGNKYLGWPTPRKEENIRIYLTK